MSRPDPLAILRLVRRTELEAARLQVAEAFDRRQKVEHAMAAMASNLARERQCAEPSSYASWAPAAQTRLATLTTHLKREETAEVAAQLGLATTKLAEQLIMDEQERRRKAARRQRLAREQRRLDDR